MGRESAHIADLEDEVADLQKKIKQLEADRNDDKAMLEWLYDNSIFPDQDFKRSIDVDKLPIRQAINKHKGKI